MEKGIDLHTHTRYSDGKLSPRELLNMAREKNLGAIAITDHDTLDGFKEYLSYGEDFGLEVVPGIEFGVKNEKERHLSEVHVLGYLVDYKDEAFLRTLDKLNESKDKWLYDQVKILNDSGFSLTVDEVKEVADAVARRPHVWKVIQRNNPNKITMDEFFRRTSFGGDMYVQRGFELSLEDCIKLIKDAGGISMLAHPGFYDIDIVMRHAVNAGINGIEVNYNYSGFGESKSQETVNRINSLAERYGLLKTGGSDFHDNVHGNDLGSVHVPYSFLEEMKRVRQSH